jgi:hypothetical protein
MSWKQFSHGFRLDPIDKGPPEALVVLLHALGATAATLTSVSTHWAAAVPTTSFAALNGTEQLDPPSYSSLKPKVLDSAARHLKPLVEQQLRTCRLDASRLVLAGFGYGGTLALHMLLRQGWSCAGVLAFKSEPLKALPRIIRIDGKVRLIECVREPDIGHSALRDFVALLIARGIDARGVLLVGSILSEEAVRHGGAYLVELVGTAQRGALLGRARVSSYAQ